MTYPQAAPGQYGSPYPLTPDQPVVPPRRPGALTVLLLTGALSALAGLIGAVIVLVGGKSLAETNVEDVINEHPDVLGLPAGMNAGNIEGGGGMFWDELVSERADTLAARAMIVVFFAVLLLVFTLLARKGAVWARVLITLTSLVALFPHVLIVGDYEPASVTALSYVALLCGLAALVCCWLPGTHRYGRALKNAR